jgi:hypothetical protein
MFSLCWPLTLLHHVSNQHDVVSSHVSSISAGSRLISPLLPCRPGPVSACPPPSIAPNAGLVARKLWIQATPWTTIGHSHNCTSHHPGSFIPYLLRVSSLNPPLILTYVYGSFIFYIYKCSRTLVKS